MDEQGRDAYGSPDFREADHPHANLAYEMNGPHRRSIMELRPRVETTFGYKMVKWIKPIELVDNYRSVGVAEAGYREDLQYCGMGVED